MNEEEMEDQITKIIREALGQISHSNCNHVEAHCNKTDPDWKPRRIHCGTPRCQELHKDE